VVGSLTGDCIEIAAAARRSCGVRAATIRPGRVPFKKLGRINQATWRCVLAEHPTETVATHHRAGLADQKVIEQLSIPIRHFGNEFAPEAEGRRRLPAAPAAVAALFGLVWTKIGRFKARTHVPGKQPTSGTCAWRRLGRPAATMRSYVSTVSAA
jgi:hypothetical protein